LVGLTLWLVGQPRHGLAAMTALHQSVPRWRFSVGRVSSVWWWLVASDP
jgi:hypothetical protein